jgi:hypothetical protein
MRLGFPGALAKTSQRNKSRLTEAGRRSRLPRRYHPCNSFNERHSVIFRLRALHIFHRRVPEKKVSIKLFCPLGAARLPMNVDGIP